MVAAVVMARPPCFLTEQGLPRDALRREETVLQLPCALKVVNVFGPDMFEVFPQRAQQFEPAGKQRLAGRVVGADAGPSVLRFGAYGCFGVLYSASFWNGSQMVS
jgi:hypothetical protein